ncbi:glycosyl transferase [Aquibium carbonis]|uniref:Glycosyl transferase n=1 Tax=Aquibium carbonis TaxID=2495581 RepID=A0A3S0GA15_9HYPH|nr:glycosyltransferase [Aquibium carbonis]RST87126.1 glycosyl transferase [Aquibium carbonis]
MTHRVLFYVQHLVGVGHVFRASRIVRSLRSRGIEVDLVFGGVPIPDLDIADARIHYLPPVRAGLEVFNRLEDDRGNPVDEDYKARRRDLLLEIFHDAKPDVVVTEAFPFGRRQMRFELIPLMEAAQARSPRPAIVASVRDILQENAKPERDLEVVDILDRFFDRVLVHGDPDFVRIEHTFPHGGKIADKLLYTGIVAPEPPVPATGDDVFDVVLSVGGGAFGHRLLLAALKARKRSVLADARWLVLTGLAATPAQKAELEALVDENVVFERFIPNLPARLAAAKLSISRAGYNTTADIYTSGCRAVMVPLSDGIETEQITRAALIEKRGLAEVVNHESETPDAIAAAIDRAMAAPAPDRSAIDIGGAANAASILAAIAGGEEPSA